MVGSPCSFKVQREKPLEDLVVGEAVRPAVGVEDGFVERPVSEVKPRAAIDRHSQTSGHTPVTGQWHQDSSLRSTYLPSVPRRAGYGSLNVFVTPSPCHEVAMCSRGPLGTTSTATPSA